MGAVAPQVTALILLLIHLLLLEAVTVQPRDTVVMVDLVVADQRHKGPVAVDQGQGVKVIMEETEDHPADTMAVAAAAARVVPVVMQVPFKVAMAEVPRIVQLVDLSFPMQAVVVPDQMEPEQMGKAVAPVPGMDQTIPVPVKMPAGMDPVVAARAQAEEAPASKELLLFLI